MFLNLIEVQSDLETYTGLQYVKICIIANIRKNERVGTLSFLQNWVCIG